MTRAHRILGVAFTVALFLMLVGCPVPIPPLGYEQTSRGNIPAARPDWIVEGTTSREDVLLRLGSPDGEAQDGSWVGYLSSRHAGGVAFVVMMYGAGGAATVEGYAERRLLLWFDVRGIVSKATFEEATCPRTGLVLGEGVKSGPCLGFADVVGETTASSDNRSPNPADVIATFADTLWTVPFYDLLTGNRPPDFAVYRGSVVVTADKLAASGGKGSSGDDARGELQIEFRYVTGIWRYTLGRTVTLVIMVDGVEHGFTVVKPGMLGMVDADKTDQLIKIVEGRLNRPALPR